MTKECSCVTHQGPHWLYLDYFDKKQNIDHLLMVALTLAEGGSIRDARRYLMEYNIEEKRRIDAKVLHMKQGETYPYSLLGDVEDIRSIAQEIMRKIHMAIEFHQEQWEQREHERMLMNKEVV